MQNQAKKTELPFSVQQALLMLNHPDVVGYLPEMLGTYVTHTKRSECDLEVIYLHVTQECDWCKTEFASRKNLKDSFQE
jgi:hypothetical protein